ncbi:unnamed protein product [Rotaria sp. Silwood2]|nr:unnamed protein product [Rotaria sp. Silwood2]
MLLSRSHLSSITASSSIILSTSNESQHYKCIDDPSGVSPYAVPENQSVLYYDPTVQISKNQPFSICTWAPEGSTLTPEIDCPSDSQYVLTPVIPMTTDLMMSRIAQAQNLIINSSSNSSIDYFQNLTSIHCTVDYLSCYNYSEYLMIQDIFTNFIWQSFTITFNDISCDVSTVRSYLFVIADSSSQKKLFRFVHKLEKQIAQNGIQIKLPRLERFHITLAGVNYAYPSNFSNAEVDCSVYDNELHALNINPFYIRNGEYSSATCFSYIDSSNPSQKVTIFRIFNDANPSSSIYCLKSLQKLQLVNTNLTILPDIKNFQNLQSLIIQTDNGYIDKHLPSEFGQLISLLELKLSNIANLEDLPDEIKYLNQLQTLTLEKIPNFNKIPDESISKLIKLNRLNLIELPNLSNIPSKMNNFQLLQQLEITNTNINNLKLENLASLYNLTVTFNAILQTIEITNMLTLSSIDIRNNNELLILKLEKLPSMRTMLLSDNAQLKTVTLNNIFTLYYFTSKSLLNLESISFENTPFLSTLQILSSPQLKSISFVNVTSISSLDLSGCQLTTFPESILTLKSLVSLVMTSNQLSTLPLTLSTDLPNLQVLHLQNNKFQGNIFQSPLIYIHELYLTNNSLTSIDGIGNFKSLQILNLDYNQISSIPLEIIKVSPTLKTITINNNLLNHIPLPMINMRLLNSFTAMNNNVSYQERLYLYDYFRQSSINISF